MTMCRCHTQGKAISQLKTLPQVLLPSTFPLVKQLVKYTRNFQASPCPLASAVMTCRKQCQRI